MSSNAHLDLSRGLMGGLSIGTQSGATGTLGAVFRREQQEGLFGLTSSHIAPLEGEHVFAPSPRDGQRFLDIGTVVEIDYEHGAALLRLSVWGTPGRVLGLPDIGGVLDEAELREAARAGAVVTKSGRTTGVTRGRLTSVDDAGIARITPEHDGAVIALGGDSGAIWMTLEGMAAALHFGGADTWAQAMPMHAIAATLALQV